MYRARNFHSAVRAAIGDYVHVVERTWILLLHQILQQRLDDGLLIVCRNKDCESFLRRVVRLRPPSANPEDGQHHGMQVYCAD